MSHLMNLEDVWRLKAKIRLGLLDLLAYPLPLLHTNYLWKKHGKEDKGSVYQYFDTMQILSVNSGLSFFVRCLIRHGTSMPRLMSAEKLRPEFTLTLCQSTSTLPTMGCSSPKKSMFMTLLQFFYGKSFDQSKIVFYFLTWKFFIVPLYIWCST